MSYKRIIILLIPFIDVVGPVDPIDVPLNSNCATVTCHNGGTCRDTKNEFEGKEYHFKCECREPWGGSHFSGQLCEYGKKFVVNQTYSS